MADSILESTKKILGLAAEYTPFDPDIITHINATFSVLSQLGVGPEDGFFITDDEPTWDQFIAPSAQLNLVRSYMFLKVRMLFDPPQTSYLIEAMNKQIAEFEWRLNSFREDVVWETHKLAEALEEEEEDELILDGGQL